MVKMSFFLLILVLLVIEGKCGMHGSVGQGIAWTDDLTWDQIRSKAKSENKFIFVDCYATWCLPCKKMDNEVYQDKVIGEFINSRFVSVRIQMDKTKFDDEKTKSWYSQAQSFQQTYNITGFPTFLFFSPDGEPVHKVTGGFSIDGFLTVAKNALDTSKQYYTILKNFKPGILDSSELKSLARIFQYNGGDLPGRLAADYLERVPLKQLGSMEHIDFMTRFKENKRVAEIAINYISKLKNEDVGNPQNVELLGEYNTNPIVSQKVATYIKSRSEKQLLSENNIVLLTYFTYSTQNKGFKMFITYERLIDSIMNDKGFSKKRVDFIISDEEIKPAVDSAKKHKIEPDWLSIAQKVKRNYGSKTSERLILSAKTQYYKREQKWDGYVINAIELGEKFGWDSTSFMAEMDKNNLAYEIFLYSGDARQLRIAAKWMEGIVRRGILKPLSGPLDTYACLLYKLGQKDRAITLEKQAVIISPKDYELSKKLKNMEDGKPIWFVTSDGKSLSK